MRTRSHKPTARRRRWAPRRRSSRRPSAGPRSGAEAARSGAAASQPELRALLDTPPGPPSFLYKGERAPRRRGTAWDLAPPGGLERVAALRPGRHGRRPAARRSRREGRAVPRRSPYGAASLVALAPPSTFCLRLLGSTVASWAATSSAYKDRASPSAGCEMRQSSRNLCKSRA